jgi:hypothetical protein
VLENQKIKENATTSIQEWANSIYNQKVTQVASANFASQQSALPVQNVSSQGDQEQQPNNDYLPNDSGYNFELPPFPSNKSKLHVLTVQNDRLEWTDTQDC